MTVLDGPLRSVSQQLMDQFGTEATLKRSTGGSYDTATRDVVGESADSQTIRGVLTKFKARPGQSEGPENVEQGDRKFTTAAQGLDWAPEVSHTVAVEGHEFEVLDVHPVYSGDQVTLYELHLRR